MSYSLFAYSPSTDIMISLLLDPILSVCILSIYPLVILIRRNGSSMFFFSTHTYALSHSQSLSFARSTQVRKHTLPYVCPNRHSRILTHTLKCMHAHNTHTHPTHPTHAHAHAHFSFIAPTVSHSEIPPSHRETVTTLHFTSPVSVYIHRRSSFRISITKSFLGHPQTEKNRDQRQLSIARLKTSHQIKLRIK